MGINNDADVHYAVINIAGVIDREVETLLKYEQDYTKRQAKDVLLKALLEYYGKELKL